MEIEFSDVRQICANHQIDIQEMKSITGSFGKKIFLINQEFLLRTSKSSMLLEQEKFKRIAGLKHVPKILQTGTLHRETGAIHYTLLTLIPGDDLINVFPTTPRTQQIQLGENIATFLDRLQVIKGTHYDIGVYVPAVPNFPGTWRDGHQVYWENLKEESAKLGLRSDSLQVLDRAFRFLQEASPALDFQTGPKLLHNDFHPKNILMDQGEFSGVIDWECSQFGEGDFELVHLIHWCLYPPQPDIDFHPFLRALFAASPNCAQVPHLAQRLTIYQIEHEIQQIIWNPREAETWRVAHLIQWMDGGVEGLLKKISA